MPEEKTGKVETVGSRQEGEFGVLLDDDNWYNGKGNKPQLNQGAEITVEYELTEGDQGIERWLVEDHDSITVEKEAPPGSNGTGSGSGSSENMGRQKPIETVGRIYQGTPPTSAKEMNQMKFILKELTNWSVNGEFEVDIPEEDGGLSGDVRDKLEELSERLGQIEEAGGPEAASTDEVAELEEEVSDIANQVENLQAGLKKMKEDDEDVIFGEDEEDQEEEDDLFDDEESEEEGEEKDE